MSTSPAMPAVPPLPAFPRCPECCRTIVPSAPNGAIRFQVCNQPPQTIPPSQAAQVLRFLWRHRDESVEWDHLYQAMESHEVNRCLDTLRNTYGIPIECHHVPKAKTTGTKGRFHLNPYVTVWEPEAGEGGFDAT